MPADDKTEWYEEPGFFWAAVALGLSLFLCCCFGGLMYCWNWSKANLGDDYRDKQADDDGGMFAALPACPTCPSSLSTCFGLLGKKDQVRSHVDDDGRPIQRTGIARLAAVIMLLVSDFMLAPLVAIREISTTLSTAHARSPVGRAALSAEASRAALSGADVR